MYSNQNMTRYHIPRVVIVHPRRMDIERSNYNGQNDIILENERNEPDYHLMESGSDAFISEKLKNVPEPAPNDYQTTGTIIHVPETDILDSSFSSDDDDDVVKNCDDEGEGNVRGMIREFFYIKKIVG
uniref:Uncharacterized protein n=1 Tax=Panagrolaimus sp. JU765 TaxID=591449 RepID=A0AC34QYE8_9BILA